MNSEGLSANRHLRSSRLPKFPTEETLEKSQGIRSLVAPGGSYPREEALANPAVAGDGRAEQKGGCTLSDGRSSKRW